MKDGSDTTVSFRLPSLIYLIEERFSISTEILKILTSEFRPHFQYAIWDSNAWDIPATK